MDINSIKSAVAECGGCIECEFNINSNKVFVVYDDEKATTIFDDGQRFVLNYIDMDEADIVEAMNTITNN